MYKVVLLFLLQIFIVSDACWSGGGGDPSEISKMSRMLNFSNKEIWNGWDAPPGAEQAWKQWLQEFNQSYQKSGRLTDEEKAAGVRPAGYKEPGWPPDWTDLAEGFGGIEPPPWAYVPKNVGKPTHCYEEPLYGQCDKNLERYGYNPYSDECQAFRYSGCGGNSNNFPTKESCQAECVNPVMGCDTDPGVDFIP